MTPEDEDWAQSQRDEDRICRLCPVVECDVLFRDCKLAQYVLELESMVKGD